MVLMQEAAAAEPQTERQKISNEGMEKGLSAGMNDCRRIVPFFL